MIRMKTAPFDLGLAEAGHPLITRAGKRVTHFEVTPHASFPIEVLVPESEGLGNGRYALRKDGRIHSKNDSEFDLFLLIEDKEPVKQSPAIISPLQFQVGGDHYRKLAIQPAEYTTRNGLGHLAGDTIAYVTRYKDKGGKQDLEKAIHCLQLLIAIEYPEERK